MKALFRDIPAEISFLKALFWLLVEISFFEGPFRGIIVEVSLSSYLSRSRLIEVSFSASLSKYPF